MKKSLFKFKRSLRYILKRVLSIANVLEHERYIKQSPKRISEFATDGLPTPPSELRYGYYPESEQEYIESAQREVNALREVISWKGSIHRGVFYLTNKGSIHRGVF